MLSQTKIAALYGNPAQRKSKALVGVKSRKVRKSRQALVMVDGAIEKAPVKAEDKGAFDGRQGSMRRSRKGRSYRLANGSRNYIVGQYHNGVEVVAYQA